MADVQISQTPDNSGGANWVWAVVVLVLVALIAWFVFAGGFGGSRTDRTDININTPGQTSPPPAAGGGTGTGGGSPPPPGR